MSLWTCMGMDMMEYMDMTEYKDMNRMDMHMEDMLDTD